MTKRTRVGPYAPVNTHKIVPRPWKCSNNLKFPFNFPPECIERTHNAAANGHWFHYLSCKECTNMERLRDLVSLFGRNHKCSLYSKRLIMKFCQFSKSFYEVQVTFNVIFWLDPLFFFSFFKIPPHSRVESQTGKSNFTYKTGEDSKNAFNLDICKEKNFLSDFMLLMLSFYEFFFFFF